MSKGERENALEMELVFHYLILEVTLHHVCQVCYEKQVRLRRKGGIPYKQIPGYEEVPGVRGQLRGSVSSFPAEADVLPEVLPTVKTFLHQMGPCVDTAVSPGKQEKQKVMFPVHLGDSCKTA